MLSNLKPTFSREYIEAKKSNFTADENYIFEIGGSNKDYKQIAGLKDSFIAADEVPIGFGNKIPLWLFGFLK